MIVLLNNDGLIEKYKHEIYPKLTRRQGHRAMGEGPFV